MSRRRIRPEKRRAGVPHETLVVADEGHSVRKPENLRRLYQQLIELSAPRSRADA